VSGTVATSGSTLTFTDADPADVDRLGGKGAGLARMTQQGLRVPPGYVIGTDACRTYLAEGSVPAGLADEVLVRLGELEAATGKAFGGGPVPLLLSVRSGAPVSMPGMMDTVLNLGLDRAAAVALAGATGDARFVADLVARFHAMYAETVLGALDPGAGVAGLVGAVDPAEDAGAVYDRIWSACERELAEDTGDSIPDDPRAQLMGAIEAVFRSWNTRRARTYRDHHGIPHDLGTAVVVQAMVFGNLSADSGSGVVFTRNPVTGEPGLFGEYLAHAQGEDVVAGTRTPDPVDRGARPGPARRAARAPAADLERDPRRRARRRVHRRAVHALLPAGPQRQAHRGGRGADRRRPPRPRHASPLARGAAPPQPANRSGRSSARASTTTEVERARAGDRLLTTGIGACPGQVSGGPRPRPGPGEGGVPTPDGGRGPRPRRSPARPTCTG
jgi:pyruvate,orthophosphate dikinase